MRIAGFIAVFASSVVWASDPTAEPVRVEHVGMVAPDVVGITLSARHVEYGRQIPYVKQAGDVVSDSDIHRFVRRDGKVIGSLVGKSKELICTMDAVRGKKLDTAWADDPASYRVKSRADPHYQTPGTPLSVFRKSKPADLGMVGPYQFESPTHDVVYLKLPAPLQVGLEYAVVFGGSELPTQRFTFNPDSLRSEAVHVNQIGFRPDDPAKVAFLSCWLGNGGAQHYESGLPFEVIEESSRNVVFKGTTVLSKAAGDKDEDAYHKNYNGTDVFQMDFSGLSRPGKYVVSVKGIGCSYSFQIADDIWRRAFVVAARGFYHQRSGIALGEPYTAFKRPRPFHPDDGLTVYASKAPLMDTGNGLNKKDSNFGNLVKGKTEEVVTNAWGGYMDAGDWDRRSQHLKASLLLLELAELFPDYFASVSLRIPESGNGLPDIVNEALWGIDFFRRLQLPEGGVRGGIESAEHPRRGEASFQESLTVMAYAPDLLASYMYAGSAARAARWLAAGFPERSAVYRESAMRAMNWAERDREREERDYLMAKHPGIRDVRNFAAAELFWLTGDLKWNSLFLESTPYRKAAGPVEYTWDSLDQADCAWVYARIDRAGVDEKVKRNCREVVLKDADLRVASTEKTGFRWAKHPYTPLLYGGLSSPENAVCVARAHVLSGAPKYLRALVLAAQTGAGANPVNMCYTTGLGQNSPQHPLQLDHRITHQPPPPGITVGGPMDNSIKELQDPFIGQFAGGVFCPPYKQWPALEAFWDVFWDPMVCEYTIQKPMAGQAYVWGYLAARGKLGKETEPAAISPPPMSPRAIAKPVAPPPGQQVNILDGTCEGTLFVPQGCTFATNGQVPLTIHFHSAIWFAIDEHLRHGLKEPLLAFYLGEGSSKYRIPFTDPQRLERMLRLTEQQLATDASTNLPHITSIDISSFSAGYGAVREILKSPEYRKLIRRVVLCDSLYGSFEADAGGKTNRVPAREHIEPWLPFARAAAAGEKTFVLTHSQVPTATYANSAQCAQALIAAVGAPIQKIPSGSNPAAQGEFPLLYRSDLGNFHIWGYGGTNAMAHMIHARHLAEVWQALDQAGPHPAGQ